MATKSKERFGWLASNLIVQEAERTLYQARGIGNQATTRQQPGEMGETQSRRLRQKTNFEQNWGCPADLLTNQTVLDPKAHRHTSRAPQVGIEPTEGSPPHLKGAAGRDRTHVTPDEGCRKQTDKRAEQRTSKVNNKQQTTNNRQQTTERRTEQRTSK